MSSLDTSPTSTLVAENSAAESAAESSAALGKKMHAGVGWTAFGSLLNQVLVLARTLILARLLSTGDFGLMGMAYTITGALSVLTNLNLGTSAIVARFDDEEQLHRHLNTVWAAGIGRGLLLTLILVAAAFPTARFYGDARLAPILMVLAATPLIASFNNIGLTLATRRVDLGLTTKYSLASSVVSLLIVVVLAFWTRNVWALVWGNVLGTVLSIALSFAFHPYRPRWQFDRREFDAAFSFGKWMFVVGIMVYITTTADNVLVGRLLGASVLGAYVVAYSIANLPQNLVSQIFGTVLLPSFAQLGRGDLRKLEDTLSRVFVMGAALLMLVTVPMALLAPEVVHVAFNGDKWQGAIAPLRVLVFVGLFRGLIQIITPLIVGMNRPEIEARSKIAEAIVFIALLYPLTTRLGAVGAAWAGVVTYAFAFVSRSLMARHLAPRAFANFPLTLFLCALSGGAGASAGAMALSALASSGPLLRLIVGSAVSVSVAGALILILQPGLGNEFAALWKSLKQRFAR